MLLKDAIFFFKKQKFRTFDTENPSIFTGVLIGTNILVQITNDLGFGENDNSVPLEEEFQAEFGVPSVKLV